MKCFVVGGFAVSFRLSWWLIEEEEATAAEVLQLGHYYHHSGISGSSPCSGATGHSVASSQ